MAITFVDVNTQDAAAAQSLTFTIPASAQSDDLMIAFVKQSENTGQQTWDDDGGGGNGWTRLAYNRTTGGRDQETAIFYKIHSGSEANPTFTWNVGGVDEPMSGSLLVYRGTDLASPIADFGYAEAQNNAAPPNPSVDVVGTPATIVVLHAATHDDISAPAAPTGYAMRSQVWNGVNDDHRNHFTADLIGLGTTGVYTPPDWQHTTLNTTPEYHTYTLVLQEFQPVAVQGFDGDEKFLWAETDKVLSGYGFGSTQGTGKVEFWSDAVGTVKSVQTIDTWSDSSIQIDPVQGSLPDNTTIYLVVTNDAGEESAPFPVGVGIFPYKEVVLALSPDHYWDLDNDYDDTGITGPVRNMTNGIANGGGAFVVTPIAEDATHSWELADVLARREIADSENMNITNTLQQRTVCGWIELGGIQQSLSAIWKEGGGVQNLAFLLGMGNELLAQQADTGNGTDTVQAWSDFRLKPLRPYHILLQYDYLGSSEFRLWVDGIKQARTDGNPLTGAFNTHAGDVVWGDPDTNLETGGTDIGYAGQEDCRYSHWATWSENSANTGALTQAEITELFRRGAIPGDVINGDTEANMQTALDTTADARPDWPLSYRIETPSGGGDLALTFTDKVFDAGITDHLEWRGSGTLTITASGTTNIDPAKTFATAAGTVVVHYVPVLTLTGLQSGTEIRVYDAGTTVELAGEEDVTTGAFSAEIQASSVDVVIHALGFLNRRIEGVDLTSGNVTLPIQQRIDRQYGNP